MSVLWLVPYGDNWGGVVERNGYICANNSHKQSPCLTMYVDLFLPLASTLKVFRFVSGQSCG